MNRKTFPKPSELTAASFKKISHILPQKEPVLFGKHIIPVCEPDLSQLETEYVTSAIKSRWVSSTGKYITLFEKEFAKKVSKTKFAFTVNSGTSAMHICLLSLGIGKGDEVILPSFTMIATANAVTYTGAKPVLVDSDPVTWNIDTQKIENKITKKTKAIIVVHTYGLPCDMTAIKKLARKYNLWIIEDAAEAHGAEFKKKKVGSLGDVAAFSFFANKLITTGEGGMVTTNNIQIAKRIVKFRNNGYGEDRHFWHKYIGYGYRMSNLQAALGFAQTERFSRALGKRRKNARLYMKLLSGVPGISFPVEPRGYKNSFWMFGIVIDKEKFGVNKNELRKYLANKGIETRSFFIPIHLQPIYFYKHKGQKFPVSENLCRDGLYLPSSSLLTKKQIQKICSEIKDLNLQSV